MTKFLILLHLLTFNAPMPINQVNSINTTFSNTSKQTYTFKIFLSVPSDKTATFYSEFHNLLEIYKQDPTQQSFYKTTLLESTSKNSLIEISFSHKSSSKNIHTILTNFFETIGRFYLSYLENIVIVDTHQNIQPITTFTVDGQTLTIDQIQSITTPITSNVAASGEPFVRVIYFYDANKISEKNILIEEILKKGNSIIILTELGFLALAIKSDNIFSK